MWHRVCFDMPWFEQNYVLIKDVSLLAGRPPCLGVMIRIFGCIRGAYNADIDTPPPPPHTLNSPRDDTYPLTVMMYVCVCGELRRRSDSVCLDLVTRLQPPPTPNHPSHPLTVTSPCRVCLSGILLVPRPPPPHRLRVFLIAQFSGHNLVFTTT